MTPESANAQKAREVVERTGMQVWTYLDYEVSLLSPKKYSDLIKTITAALSAKDKELEERVPTEEEIEEARVLWAENIGRLEGLPERMIQDQKHLVGKICWNDAVSWAINQLRKGEK